MNLILRAFSAALALSAVVACNPNVIGGGDGPGTSTSGNGASTGTSTGSGASTGLGGTGPGASTGWGGTGSGASTGWGGTGSGASTGWGGTGSGASTGWGGTGSGASTTTSTCNAISASSFNQTCQTDADCVAVYSGSLCTDCFCPTAAINQDAVSAYTTVFDADMPPPFECNCPASPPPTCVDGACALQ